MCCGQLCKASARLGVLVSAVGIVAVLCARGIPLLAGDAVVWITAEERAASGDLLEPAAIAPSPNDRAAGQPAGAGGESSRRMTPEPAGGVFDRISQQKTQSAEGEKTIECSLRLAGLRMEEDGQGSSLFFQATGQPYKPQVLSGDVVDVLFFHDLDISSVKSALAVQRGLVDHMVLRQEEDSCAAWVYLVKADRESIDWEKAFVVRGDGFVVRLPRRKVLREVGFRDGEIVLQGEGLDGLQATFTGLRNISVSLPDGRISRFLPLRWNRRGQAQGTLKSVQISSTKGKQTLELETRVDVDCRDFAFRVGPSEALLSLKPLPELPAVRVERVLTIGKKGYEADDLFLPSAVAAGVQVFLVVDTFNHRLKVYDFHGSLRGIVGKYGATEGAFDQPADVASDSQGNLYVADMLNNRIVKFDRSLSFVLQWGQHGSGPGRFRNPQAVAVSEKGEIFVADLSNRIQVFDSNGRVLRFLGEPGGKSGQFVRPVGMAFDGHGNLYVADSGNGRVQKFDAAGKYAEEWKEVEGWGNFARPWAIRHDQDFFYVLDQQKNAVVILDGCRRLVKALQDDFDGPSGIAVQGNLLAVADRNHHLVKVYKLMEERVGVGLR